MTARTSPTPLAALMLFEAATLFVMSALHLGGSLAGHSEPFDPSHAGVAEAVIGAVLVAGAVALLRGATGIALASTGFAIVGFIVGLNFTIRGGGSADIAYHAIVLPLLVLTFAALLRRRSDIRRPGSPRAVSR